MSIWSSPTWPWGDAHGTIELRRPPKVGDLIDMEAFCPELAAVDFPSALEVEGVVPVKNELQDVTLICLAPAVLDGAQAVDRVVAILEAHTDLVCMAYPPLSEQDFRR